MQPCMAFFLRVIKKLFIAIAITQCDLLIFKKNNSPYSLKETKYYEERKSFGY